MLDAPPQPPWKRWILDTFYQSCSTVLSVPVPTNLPNLTLAGPALARSKNDTDGLNIESLVHS